MIVFNKLDNHYTVWQLYKDYGINKQKSYRVMMTTYQAIGLMISFAMLIVAVINTTKK